MEKKVKQDSLFEIWNAEPKTYFRIKGLDKSDMFDRLLFTSFEAAVNLLQWYNPKYFEVADDEVASFYCVLKTQGKYNRFTIEEVYVSF